jgi:L-2-hydroxycarboxylate dehydrogenase (NAD+)
MKEAINRLPVDTVHAFMVDVFKAQGVRDEDARICADVLIASDLRGIESHGVGRLAYYYERIQAGIQFPQNEMEIVKESETTALVDGHHGMGHPTAYR